MVEAVLHIRRKKNTNADDVPSEADTSNDNGEDSEHKRKLECVISKVFNKNLKL